MGNEDREDSVKVGQGRRRKKIVMPKQHGFSASPLTEWLEGELRQSEQILRARGLTVLVAETHEGSRHSHTELGLGLIPDFTSLKLWWKAEDLP